MMFKLLHQIYYSNLTMQPMINNNLTMPPMINNDKTAYKTTFINKLEWEALDPTDNSKSVCTRDITTRPEMAPNN